MMAFPSQLINFPSTFPAEGRESYRRVCHLRWKLVLKLVGSTYMPLLWVEGKRFKGLFIWRRVTRQGELRRDKQALCLYGIELLGIFQRTCGDKLNVLHFAQNWPFCVSCPLTIRARTSGRNFAKFDQRVDPCRQKIWKNVVIWKLDIENLLACTRLYSRACSTVWFCFSV